ncbi:MAG: DUF2877 domain-containing protein, partial [Actinomycetota bacterium]
VPHNPEHDVAAVARRGSDLLAASGHGPDPLAALTVARPHLLAGGRLLLYALRDRDPELAGDAARALTGRGPGLTPDGDDLLAASAAATRAFGAATAYPDAGAEALRSALVLDDLGERTGALSASLLRLAVDGRVIDPVRALLDLSAGAATWTGALARLERIGHGTGGTYALGCALTALALSAGDQPSSMNPRREEKS